MATIKIGYVEENGRYKGVVVIEWERFAMITEESFDSPDDAVKMIRITLAKTLEKEGVEFQIHEVQ